MIRNIIQKVVKNREFSADNCRKHQEEEIRNKAHILIDEMKSIISYKVANTNEKAIIYSIDDPENEKYEIVEKYFTERGFKVFKTKFLEELGDAEFLVISWLI